MTLAEFIQELSDRVQIDAADEQLKALVKIGRAHV